MEIYCKLVNTILGIFHFTNIKLNIFCNCFRHWFVRKQWYLYLNYYIINNGFFTTCLKVKIIIINIKPVVYIIQKAIMF